MKAPQKYIFAALAALIVFASLFVMPRTSRLIADLRNKGNDSKTSLKGEEAVTYLRQQGLNRALVNAMNADKYKVHQNDRGLSRDSQRAYYADNPAQSLTAFFDRTGILLAPSGQARNDWSFGMRLTGIGYGSSLSEVAAADPKLDGNRVSIRHTAGSDAEFVSPQSEIDEWYLNGPGGIEQGFNISQRPGGHSHGDALRLRLAFDGNLEARLVEGESGIDLMTDDGQRAIRYDGLTVHDARGHQLNARFGIVQSQVLIDVDDAQAVYPVTIDPTFSQQQKLTASDGGNGDLFGLAVDVDGDTVVVGSRLNDVGSHNNQGSAYVFVRTGVTWVEQQKLTAPDGNSDDQFGFDVAISGNTLVVGANLADVGANANAGAAYVFVRTGTVWSFQQKLTSSTGAAGNQFGMSVSISGDTLAVGESQGDVAPSSNQGAAYIFVRSAGIWSEQQKLSASDAAVGDNFGWSVAVDGNTAVIGARAKANGANTLQGAVYVYVRSGSVWSEQQKLTASDGAAGDQLGIDVGISGDTLVAGANLDDVGANANQGSAYAFVRSGTVWSLQQKLTAAAGAAGDQFGWSVGIYGDTIAIGTPIGDVGTHADQGAGYVFGRVGSVWSELQRLTASDGAAGDTLGNAIAIRGDTIVAGAPFADPANADQGAAYIFALACQVTCGSNIVTSTDPGQCGAFVSYQPSQTSGSCGSVTCNPGSNTFFQKGTTTVNCTSDAGQNCSFTVTVNDSQGPVITTQGNIARNTDLNACSAVVNYTASASDNCDASVSVSCTPASGSTFNKGVTTVTCSATDVAGNHSNSSFNVTVNDSQPPTVSCPSNITANNTPGQCSAVVNYPAPQASDNCPGVTTNCIPASGSTFPKGATTVTCTSTDAAGNTANCGFTVTVVDNQPPTVTCPSNISATTSGTTALVSYTTPSAANGMATDNCGGVSVLCVPPSGSVFPVGTTTVVCTAIDGSNNTGQCSFGVSVSFSPPQMDKIAFESLRDGNVEIYVMNADGSSQTRLTHNSCIDSSPAWSPDRSKIAFTSLRDGNPEIYVMNADGSNQTRLTNNSAIEDDPAWSPDGTKIAFWSTRNGNAEIYVMNANGSNQTRLTNNSATDIQPDWSPDGSKIVFTSNRANLLNLDIYVMNADGSGVTRLTADGAADDSPDWSPDGTKIVFTSNRTNLLDFEVWVMNANGSNPIRLTSAANTSVRPSWSRDGTKIAFATNRDSLLNFEIYTMNANGTGQTRLTSNPAIDFSPSW